MRKEFHVSTTLSLFQNVPSKSIVETFLIVQYRLKKFTSPNMEMSFNILEMLSYFHHFYSQFLFKLNLNNNNNNNNNQLNFFLFFDT